MAEELIDSLSKTRIGEHGHGPIASMGVVWDQLPTWDDIDIDSGGEALSGAVEVGTRLVLGKTPTAERPGAKPLELTIPLMIADMSFGSLSREAKTALAKGAELAGAAICSGEGGILKDEKAQSSRYLYQLGTGEFGYETMAGEERPRWHGAQAFHFKGGQGAKTGTGGHLPGAKVSPMIAKTRGKEKGKDIISPPTFETMRSVEDFQARVETVKEAMGDVPIGFKLSANRIEDDIDFALRVGADYIILDGRGGATGAAPILFRDHISVPTMAAIVRARRYIDAHPKGAGVKLIATGGLRVPTDFVKAMALGADGVALANTALQALGCVATRRCESGGCPVGIATQVPELRGRFKEKAELRANWLGTLLGNCVEVMKSFARDRGHADLSGFTKDDLVTSNPEVARLTGIRLR
ncbi:glutamate synthase domain protein [Plesiocystis pacifica SIR-1]|uniref:Glutamate synthase domain protein n=1 Tax=Plesiocystis pacifica SIR-1 TaxID=391625 RepID=A6G8Z8_9BACT|nr:FMN-binding glutamate synthase family protein [Plesiocystis pacifica]EDM77684.1 glutamate synthase domain protein [Plesiocystis pacifica SIR-1]